MSDDRITVEQFVRIRIPRHELLIELTLEDAKELGDGIIAMFARPALTIGVSYPKSGLLPNPPMSSYVGMFDMVDGASVRIPPPTDEGLDRLAADLGVTIPVTESVLDDAQRMISNHVVDADEMVDDAKCGCGGDPFCTRGGITSVYVDQWHHYRAKYPTDSHSQTVTRITWCHKPRPSVESVRSALRSSGITVADPNPRRTRRIDRTPRFTPRPPLGYFVVDIEAWHASASLMSESEIRELGEGGLARIGLRKEAA